MTSVRFFDTSFSYDGASPAIRNVKLDVRESEMFLVIGGSGSGKSTLLRCANGLVPHVSGGTYRGDVVVGGRSVLAHKPRDLADVVGFVHQDPDAQFVSDRVEDDIAFALENLGIEPRAMRRRVEEALDAVGVAHLRDRVPSELSGGERQRCAIAGALVAGPSVLVLDEPTSQLDPQGADDVFAILHRLNSDLGTTVLIAEHRLERALVLADRVALLRGAEVANIGAPHEVVAPYEGAPPVTEVGRILDWDPLPLSVKQARRFASDSWLAPPARRDRPERGDVLLAARDLEARFGARPALRGVSTEICKGDVVALLGRNGAGKTTLLRTLGGLVSPSRGIVDGAAVTGYVPQDPNVLLSRSSVRAEIRYTLDLLGRRDTGIVDQWIERLDLSAVADRHPRTLSGGQRQRVAIASVAVGEPDVLLLDEPTRGMDAASRNALDEAMRARAADGGAVVIATHDVELAARAATRAVVLADGEVIAEGDSRDVLAGSMFAPQVARLFPGFLTVDDVCNAVGRTQ